MTKKKINIIGIGGASKVLAKFTKNQNLFAIETNQKILDFLPDHITKIVMGNGDGAGGNIELAKQSFDLNKIDQIFDCDLLILIAGLGGGTGSGLTPEIAKIAKEKQILSKIILFSPLESEGREQIASKSLIEIQSLELPITLIDNQKIKDKIPGELKMSEVYNILDFGAIETVKTIENILSSQNIDYKDISKSFVDGYVYSNSVRGNTFQEAMDNLDKTTSNDINFANSKHILFSVKGDMLKSEFDSLIKTLRSNTTANLKDSLEITDKDFEINVIVTGINNKIEIDDNYSQIIQQKQSDYKAGYISEVRSQSGKKAYQSN